MSNLLTYVHHVTEKLHVIWTAESAEVGNRHYTDGKPLWDQLALIDHTPLDSGASIRSANIAEGHNAVADAPVTVGEEVVESAEVKEKRTRRTKAQMAADAAAAAAPAVKVIPITESAAPVIVATAPAPSAVPVAGLTAPGFLQTGTPAEPPSPPALPILPASPQFVPPPPSLAKRAVAELARLAAVQPNGEALYGEWLVKNFGVGTDKTPWSELLTTISFKTDENVKPIADALSVV